MTRINKAQGQTLQRVGVYLSEPCFSHGQLYVAASRVGLPAHIRFAVDKSATGKFRTRNVVWRDALTGVATAAGPAMELEVDAEGELTPVDTSRPCTPGLDFL